MTQRLTDVFEVSNGHDLDLVTLDRLSPAHPEAVAYVSRQRRGNGVSAYVRRLADVEPAPAGTLSMALGGTYAAATHLQPRPYYTAQNVRVLASKTEMTDNEKLWWAMCITHNRFRFGYGRHANRTFRQLKLPSAVPRWVADTPIPDFSPLKRSAAKGRLLDVDATDWHTYRLGSLFDVVRGRYIPTTAKGSGSTPEVTSAGVRGGVSRWVDLPADHPGGVITVARNGSVGQAFYQARPFFATDDVHVLYPRHRVGIDELLFVCTVIRQERYRFNYGRKWSVAGMREAEIKLPAGDDSEPDWRWMRTFMRRLPFSSALRGT